MMTVSTVTTGARAAGPPKYLSHSAATMPNTRPRMAGSRLQATTARS